MSRMPARSLTFTKMAETVPPHAWFGVSAVFHYLGPSFAVLLFPAVGVLGVAWLRIASAALIFAPWTRPWRALREADTRTRLLVIGLGACLAVMNTAFYLAAGPAADEPGRGDGIRRHHRGRAVRFKNRAQPAGLGVGGRRRVRPDRREMVDRAARSVLGDFERRAVRRLYRAGAQGGGRRAPAAASNGWARPWRSPSSS